MSSGTHPPRKPCPNCGAKKEPGRGRKYCDSCQESAQWKALRKRAVRANLKRHPCELCGGLKEKGHGRRVCKRCVAARRKPRKCMSCPAVIVPPARKCQSCKARANLKKREYEKERHRRNRAAGKFTTKKKRRPSIRERERQRIDYRLRAEREGRTVGKPRVNGLLVKTQENRRRHEVDVAPLLPHIRAYVADTGVSTLGELASIRPADITKMLDGALVHIRFAQADRLCIELGLHVDMVYMDGAAA